MVCGRLLVFGATVSVQSKRSCPANIFGFARQPIQGSVLRANVVHVKVLSTRTGCTGVLRATLVLRVLLCGALPALDKHALAQLVHAPLCIQPCAQYLWLAHLPCALTHLVGAL